MCDIAVGAGVSEQDVTGNFNNLGFAAALMCQTPKQDYCKIRQRNFIDVLVRPTFKNWLRAAIVSGVFEEKYQLDISITQLDDYVQSAKFKGKRWAFVNPLVQAQTLIIMLEAGIMAPQQVQDQLPDGVSIESLYTLISEANDEQDKHGLDFHSVDVTRPDVSNGKPGETVATPDEKDDTGTPAKTKPANPVRSRAKSKSRIPDNILDLINAQGDGTARNGAGKH
jgi:capsid protein